MKILKTKYNEYEKDIITFAVHHHGNGHAGSDTDTRAPEVHGHTPRRHYQPVSLEATGERDEI